MAKELSQDRKAPLHGAEVARGLLAVTAGWLVPGLGHVVVGRWRRGLAFAALIAFSFGMGLAHDGRLALRDARQPFLSSLQVVANAGIGPADLVARWAVYGGPVYALPSDDTVPLYSERNTILRSRSRSIYSLYGTAYLWTAGLMNLLLLFEVWDFSTGRKD